jgi:hypothetical protein
MLTGRQLMSIVTPGAKPPHRLSDLSRMYVMRPLSVRKFYELLQKQQAYFICEIRDASILTSVSDYQGLLAAWKTSQPTKATMLQFEKVATAAGLSIKYVSGDWRRIGVVGSVAAFAQLNILRIDLLLQAAAARPAASPAHPPPASAILRKMWAVP